MLPRSLRSVTRHSKDECGKRPGHSGRDDRKGRARHGRRFGLIGLSGAARLPRSLRYATPSKLRINRRTKTVRRKKAVRSGRDDRFFLVLVSQRSHALG
jgi:hypothetical protein